jgi:hypothetical protein
LDEELAMQPHDYHYYSDRARQERETALRCQDNSARLIHLELAERYRRLAEPTQRSA